MDFESISLATRTHCHVDLGTCGCSCGLFFEATVCPLFARATVASMFVLLELVAADGISPLWGSNPRPYAYEAHALPAELRRPCCRVPVCATCMNNIALRVASIFFLTSNAARVKPFTLQPTELRNDAATTCRLALACSCFACGAAANAGNMPRGLVV